MEQKQITVIAKVKARKGMEATLGKILLSLIEPSRADEGCVDYILHRDPENHGQFMFFENWTNKEALDKHLQQPHLQNFIKQSGELLEEPLDVTQWERIG